MIQYPLSKTRVANNNSFDLLRILLAIGVLISHAYVIVGYQGKDILMHLSKDQVNVADVSVMGFFVLSGYLITGSFERADSMISFLTHRILRVFPGLWFCLILTAFIFAPFIYVINGGNTTDFSFFGKDSAESFVYSNFFSKINQWSISSTLGKANYQDSINGSLWSLFPEILCYCLTAVLGMFQILQKNKWAVALIFVSVWMVFIFKAAFGTNIGPTFLHLSSALKLYTCYMAGSLMFLYQNNIKRELKLVIFLALCSASLLRFGGFLIFSPIIMAYLLIEVFKKFKVKIKTDISYGIYIYGFPIQQALYAIFNNRLGYFTFLLLSIIISAIFGFLSYHLVEKHFIKLKKPVDAFLNKRLNVFK